MCTICAAFQPLDDHPDHATLTEITDEDETETGSGDWAPEADLTVEIEDGTLAFGLDETVYRIEVTEDGELALDETSDAALEIERSDPTTWHLITEDGTEYTLSLANAEAASVRPVGTVDDFVDQLLNDYWISRGGSGDWSWADTTISVNITALTADGQQLARWAMEAWENATGLTFVETTSAAQMNFDDNQSGAFANFGGWGNITWANVNVSTSWVATYGATIDSYSLQTYIHEIGHAIGLGHAGNYNGSANFGTHEVYSNDSWQMSIMSYFSQQTNTTIDADRAFAVTAMLADIAAAQTNYGPSNVAVQAGDTVWGANSTLSGYMGDLFAQALGEEAEDTSLYSGNRFAFTVWDSGGTDTIDFSPVTADQSINLREEKISDVMGHVGNMVIARGTTIEHAIGGQGDDEIIGNGARNTLEGGQGTDTLKGSGGKDTLKGGSGRDQLDGGNGADLLKGGSGKDRLEGGKGNDTLEGGGGRDLLIGNGGKDVYAFDFGQGGQDRIKGFDADNDVIRFDGGRLNQVSVSRSDGDTYIDHGGETIRIIGEKLSKSEIDFEFV